MIKTASWFTPLPPGHVRIGISRGTRGVPAGYRRYSRLQPGEWWDKKMLLEEYLPRYQAQLDKLDPHKVATDVLALADGDIPVLTCWERLGRGLWCHRAFVASWMASAMGEPVPEVSFEHLPQNQHPLLPQRRGTAA